MNNIPMFMVDFKDEPDCMKAISILSLHVLQSRVTYMYTCVSRIMGLNLHFATFENGGLCDFVFCLCHDSDFRVLRVLYINFLSVRITGGNSAVNN